MKKKTFLWKMLSFMMVGILSVGFTSCDDSDEPNEVTPNKTSVTFSETGGSESIQLTCNTKWTVSGNPSWLNVGPSSGNGNGTITLNADANTSEQIRTCTLYLTAGTASATINITQMSRSLDLADRVAGAYSGKLTLGSEVLEDAYIIKVTKLTSTTVSVDAPFFGGEKYNFNLEQQGNQILFTNSTMQNLSMVVMGSQMTVNYLSGGGNMLTYIGTK